jgi:hypothetical protein
MSHSSKCSIDKFYCRHLNVAINRDIFSSVRLKHMDGRTDMNFLLCFNFARVASRMHGDARNASSLKNLIFQSQQMAALFPIRPVKHTPLLTMLMEV